MAPNAEVLVGPYPQKNNFNKAQQHKPRRISMEGLQRAISDLSYELTKESADNGKLPPVSEVENAECECCGMSEECTPEYINRVREKYRGKWICGICSEAVKEEAVRNGGKMKEALDCHFSVCSKFNRIGRTHPVLFQAPAVKEILKKCSRADGRVTRSASSSPRDNGSDAKMKCITRSSSCIPAITKDINDNRSAATKN